MEKLIRSKDRKIAGVCAGVAEHFGWDVKSLRLIWFVLAIALVGAPILFYLILWFLMPEKNQESYADRMQKRLNKKE